MSDSTAVEIKRKSSGPEGTTVAPESLTIRTALKITLVPFMLEDYVDSVIANATLANSDNAERIPWEKLKEQLGL